MSSSTSNKEEERGESEENPDTVGATPETTEQLEESATIIKEESSSSEEEEPEEDSPQQPRRCTRAWRSRTRRQKCCIVGFGGAVLLLLIMIVLATVASFWSRSWVDQVTEVPPVPDPIHNNNNNSVIIVGAGVSGLFAAYTLDYLGVANLTILEASHRAGGRVQRTDDLFDFAPLDLGAEWIHTNPQILQDLLLYENDRQQAAKIETITYEHRTLSFVSPVLHRTVRRDWLRWFYKEYKFRNSTWSQWLEQFVLSYVEENIVYNATVETVEYGDDEGGGVLVTTKDGSIYTADRVILAVPLKILQDGDISFSPTLPEDRTQLWQGLHWGPGGKLMIEFQERFYTDFSTDRTLTQHLFHLGQARGFYDALFGKPNPHQKNIMGVLQVGDHAAHWETDSDDELFQNAMATLDDMYNGKATENYIQHYIQNWSQEPYIRGTYLTDGYTDKMDEPVGDRLFFATDLRPCTLYHGAMVQCAAISGRQAAVAASSSYRHGGR